MLSLSIYFSLVALTWAFSTSNETSPFSEDQLEEFEPKGGDVPPWTQAQQGVLDAQLPEFSTVPPGVRMLDTNPAQIQLGVVAPNAQVPIARVSPGVRGPNMSPFDPGPIPLEQLRQIFLKGGNASVAFIVYTYVNLLNKGSIGGQTSLSDQPPPTTWSQVPGTMNRNVYPPYQNPQLQPSGTINGNVYPPNQNPSQPFPQKRNGGGYPPNRNTWSQSPQATNLGGRGYSSYHNRTLYGNSPLRQ
ncbi:unnamed protein product [Cylicocyclus nassatus]|uniref:Uncharacterized protein n=1 Tax=Cylicocyclus nassatus TaxID=53992 RepID=A0AA36HE55_CYLNA|nr:unnamed protein product [Cylicocyclus nassatus]